MFLLTAVSTLLLGRGETAAQSNVPEALQAAAAIVDKRSQSLNLPHGLRAERDSVPLLVDVGSLVAAIRDATGVMVSPAEIDAAIQAPFRDVASDRAVQCEPWPNPDSRTVSCRSMDDGYHIKFESLAPSRDGWTVIARYVFTAEERAPGQSQIQLYRVKHCMAREDGRWVQKSETVLIQS